MKENSGYPIKRGRTALVITNYSSAYPNPLLLKQGEEIIIEGKETSWPGWVWCTGSDGKCGWVPETYFKKNENKGRMLCNYDATELTVKIGEKLTVLREECGWLWCRNGQDKLGWVPKENVQIA